MVALHTAWLISCVLEVWLLDRPFLPWLGIVALVVFLGAFALRYWVISTLGDAGPPASSACRGYP